MASCTLESFIRKKCEMPSRAPVAGECGTMRKGASDWGKLLTESLALNKYQAMPPFCQATQLPWFLLARAT